MAVWRTSPGGDLWHEFRGQHLASLHRPGMLCSHSWASLDFLVWSLNWRSEVSHASHNSGGFSHNICPSI